jgi:hypothetical protein
MSVAMSNKKPMSFNHQLLPPVSWASTAPGGEIQWKRYYMFCIVIIYEPVAALLLV